MNESADMISQLEEVLGQAEVNYINDSSEDNQEQVQALSRAIEAHERYYASLEKSLKRKRRLAELQQYVVNPPPQAQAQQPAAAPGANQIQRVPADLPTFRRSDKEKTTKDPTTFLRMFETTMYANCFPMPRWNNVLKSRVSTSAMTFVQTQIIDKNLDWDGTKDAFKKHFLAHQHAYLKGQQLDALRRTAKKHMDIATYNDHFSELVNDSGRSMAGAPIMDRPISIAPNMGPTSPTTPRTVRPSRRNNPSNVSPPWFPSATLNVSTAKERVTTLLTVQTSSKQRQSQYLSPSNTRTTCFHSRMIPTKKPAQQLV